MWRCVKTHTVTCFHVAVHVFKCDAAYTNTPPHFFMQCRMKTRGFRAFTCDAESKNMGRHIKITASHKNMRSLMNKMGGVRYHAAPSKSCDAASKILRRHIKIVCIAFLSFVVFLLCLNKLSKMGDYQTIRLFFKL